MRIIRSYPGFLDLTGKAWDARSCNPTNSGSPHPDITAVESLSSRLHKLPNPNNDAQRRSVMSENANQKGAQQKIETSSEAYGSGSASGFLSENAKNPKEASDWLGGPQNGNETPGKSDYTKHRFNETPSKSTEGAYQQNGQSWLGGPQNGNEIPGNGGNGGNG
jgi:hypothetical protein